MKRKAKPVSGWGLKDKMTGRVVNILLNIVNDVDWFC